LPFEACPGKKVQEFQPIKNLSMVVCICYPSYAGGINRRIAVNTGLGIM
jgi:hypothetical protein